jgi:cytochrome c-type biogenesis protein CcmH/NrfG
LALLTKNKPANASLWAGILLLAMVLACGVYVFVTPFDKLNALLEQKSQVSDFKDLFTQQKLNQENLQGNNTFANLSPEQQNNVIKRSLWSKPKDAAYWLAMSELLLKKGQLFDAMYAYEHCLRLQLSDDQAYSVYLALALIHFIKDQNTLSPQAYSYFEKALAINPLDIRAYEVWVRFEVAQGNVEGAKNVLKRYLAQPNVPDENKRYVEQLIKNL